MSLPLSVNEYGGLFATQSANIFVHLGISIKTMLIPFLLEVLLSQFASFYFVCKDYHKYIQAIDHHVTNVEYANRTKFVYGIVYMTNEKIGYFVPVTSYSKSKENNILIKIKDHGRQKTVGSLRFNYMFPVPARCLIRVNFKNASFFSNEERIKIEKEYLYIKKVIGIKAIKKKAEDTYKAVIAGTDKELCKNSCNFLLLEKAYKEYILSMQEIPTD